MKKSTIEFEKKHNEFKEMINYVFQKNIPSTDYLMHAAYKSTMLPGGKRLRPLLTLISANAIGGNFLMAIEPAAALEIIHNFTLLHDDIMDQSPTRHNKPTIYQQFGSDIGILTGDIMIGYAFKILHNAVIYPKHNDSEFLRVELYDAMADAIIEVCKGQELDMRFGTQSNVSLDDYLVMAKLKTSSLFRCAVKIGAITNDASRYNINLLDDIATSIGLAFQIQDDILDFNAEKATFGKELGHDVFDWKKTYPIIKLREVATEKADIDFVEAYFVNEEGKNTPEAVQHFLTIFNKYDVLENAEKEYERYYDIAKEKIKLIENGNESYCAMLSWFIDKMSGRNF